MSETFDAEPDFETLAVAVLRASSRMTDVVPEANIGTRLPRGWDATKVAFRIRRIGGLPTEDRVGRLCRGRLQGECYAPDEQTACDGASIALAELRAATGIFGEDDDPKVVVTKVGQDLGLFNSPDPDSDAARYVFGVVLYGHRTAG